MKILSLAVFSTVAFFGCSKLAAPDENAARERWAPYEKQSELRGRYEGVFMPILEIEPTAVNLYDSITIEHTGCYGSCPAFKATFLSSGEAKLEAKSFMPKLGKFEGLVSKIRYSRLCDAIGKLGFEKFKEQYTQPVTDNATCIITVKDKLGVRSVSDYANAGPAELWLIEIMLDRVASEVEWVPEKEPNQ